uniref:Uncharacterized protein n=1 Tax=Romanomermis culicivorax TaxID=13658 RepID=A0A915KAL9_ROMCU
KISVNEETEGVAKEEQEVEVEEFCVKYKNFSYLHCEWKSLEELEKGDKKIAGKIKRFKMKQQNVLFVEEFDEEQPFHPDMITVERILDVSRPLNFDQKSKDELTKELLNVSCKSDENHELDVENDDQQHNETTTEDKEQEKPSNNTNKSPVPEVHYLVKWRGLAYEDCTWELESDVDPDKIKAFEARRYPPSSDNKYKTRPDDWRKVPEDTKYKNDNELREYQMEGVNWLLFCWCNRQNCILADEMGLGKTVQSVTFLVEIQKISALRGPFLIIAPLSTIINWQREFETWSDFNTVVYHGSSASRRMIQEYEMFYKDNHGERLSTIFKFDVIITTYEMVMLEREMLKDIPWRVLIIDEAHRLKNRNCKLMSGLSQFKVEHRVLLTGTPLQNNIEELFSLLNFLEPKQFCNSQMFLEEFGTLQSDDQVQQLQEILKPMMLRRLKEDVEKSLKPKEETIIEVELTNIQKKYYRAILERNFTYLSRGSSVPSLMNTMMELRKCCNHPFLINGAEDQIIQELKSSRKEDQEKIEEDQLYYQGMVQSSGKLVLIDKLLPRLRSSGHKVLVFSQMVRCLDILEDYLIAKKYPFERIDGNVRGDLRQAAIDRFSKPDCDRFVFLLCTRAGGLGINLTAADTVIIFDSDWNPQNDLQAQARCHRIGQEKFVKVYRLICRNSYEREMFDKASLKLGLDKAVLQSMGSSKEKPTAQLSKKEIEELLRKGAYGALMDENNEGDAFCEEDIDQILQRRTTTVTVQAGVKGSTFAKASFAVSGNRSDIDVNDPNFWQKWARKANIDVDTNSN